MLVELKEFLVDVEEVEGAHRSTHLRMILQI